MVAVLSGRIRISATSPDGREVTLNMIDAGEVFGEIALLDGKPRSADATALEDSNLMMVERRHFLPYLTSNNDLATAHDRRALRTSPRHQRDARQFRDARPAGQTGSQTAEPGRGIRQFGERPDPLSKSGCPTPTSDVSSAARERRSTSRCAPGRKTASSPARAAGSSCANPPRCSVSRARTDRTVTELPRTVVMTSRLPATVTRPAAARSETNEHSNTTSHWPPSDGFPISGISSPFCVCSRR